MGEVLRKEMRKKEVMTGWERGKDSVGGEMRVEKILKRQK